MPHLSPLALISVALWVLGVDGDLKGAVAVAVVAGLGALLLGLSRIFLRGEARVGLRSALWTHDRARRGTIDRQRDPDAAGRSRPRAPTVSPALA
ncbi:DUF6412 domain-containing protein [Sinosporangium siamense]|uniref:Uncharacterized protein n=1 Tax=Sinosporangium siamense TaxID=1367973 RepID=A0A919V866_9ACTN|nr:DUF6412 domain-containing protein [Sinosporangium siamense]GII95835.1 hypothetical protein Ssi02_60660 [Sinosporangium siamense]